MGEKTPDQRNSIERRSLLKGLGIGAVGIAGAGATAVGAQDQTPSPGNLAIDYIKVVPEGADATVNEDSYVDHPWAGADLVFGLNFEPQGGKQVFSGNIPVGYQFTVVEQQSRKPVSESFEEGSSRAFAGTVNISPSGEAIGRENFSLSGLGPDDPGQPPNAYFAVLTVTDYRGQLDPVLGADEFTVASPQGGEGNGNQTATPTTTPAGNETDGNESA